MSAPVVVAGGASAPLAARIADELGTGLADCTVERFPDGEAHVAFDQSVRGEHVYLVCATGPPADAHLMELALLADASRRGDAGRVTAVIPYFGYARQDRRTRAGEAVPTRVAADLLQTAGVERVVVVDPHTRALEAMFGIPVDAVSAVGLLADAVRPRLPEHAVVVAPDLGAVKLAERAAALLELPTVVVRKSRVSGTSVEAGGVIGDIGERAPLLVDDMVSTGATLEAAATALRDAGCSAPMTVAAVHGLFAGDAAERLAAMAPREVVTTDSLPVPTDPGFACRSESLAGVLAALIGRLHRGEALEDLASHG